jgi:hypothetical protein
MVVGLKLSLAETGTVTEGVTPDGNGPALGCVVETCPLTGIIVIAATVAEIIIRAITIKAKDFSFILLKLTFCNCLFSPLLLTFF